MEHIFLLIILKPLNILIIYNVLCNMKIKSKLQLFDEIMTMMKLNTCEISSKILTLQT